MDKFLIEDFWFLVISIPIAAIVVIFIFWLLDRSPLSNWFKSSEDIAASFISVPAFLFGLVISTFATGIWNDHVAANNSLINEASAVRTIIRVSQTIPSEDGNRLFIAAQSYVNSVIDSEWPDMTKNNPEKSEQSLLKLQSLSLVADSIGMMSNQNMSNLSRLDSSIDALYHERLVRLSLAFDNKSFIKWPSIYLLSFLLLFTIGLLQLRCRRAMKITLCMGALCIGSSMLFLLLNSSPYRGPTSIQPTILENSIKLAR